MTYIESIFPSNYLYLDAVFCGFCHEESPPTPFYIVKYQLFLFVILGYGFTLERFSH